jgi:putative transposase
VPNYHRFYIPNAIVAVTLVTYNRQPTFSTPQAAELFLNIFNKIIDQFHYDCIAYSILPDHVHLLIQLSQDHPNFSLPIRELKRRFSVSYKKSNPVLPLPNSSRQKHHETTIWQRRFWDHIIKDERDLERHLDYIHFNPVKHGLTDSPTCWPWSSYSNFVEKGYYSKEWVPDLKQFEDSDNWGE